MDIIIQTATRTVGQEEQQQQRLHAEVSAYRRALNQLDREYKSKRAAIVDEIERRTEDTREAVNRIVNTYEGKYEPNLYCVASDVGCGWVWSWRLDYGYRLGQQLGNNNGTYSEFTQYALKSSYMVDPAKAKRIAEAATKEIHARTALAIQKEYTERMADTRPVNICRQQQQQQQQQDVSVKQEVFTD